METLVGLFCAAILCVAAAFHIYWGLDGLMGIGVSLPLEVDGTPVVQPSKQVTIVVGAVLLTVMLATLAIVTGAKPRG